MAQLSPSESALGSQGGLTRLVVVIQRHGGRLEVPHREVLRGCEDEGLLLLCQLGRWHKCEVQPPPATSAPSLQLEVMALPHLTWSR